MFSTTEGAGFTILRNRIAADSSSIEPNSPGSPSTNPTYVGIGGVSSQVRPPIYFLLSSRIYDTIFNCNY